MFFLIVSFFFLYVEQEPSQIPPAEAGPSWGAQGELSSKPACSQARQPKGQRLFPLLSSCFLCLLISFSLLNSYLQWSDTTLTHLCFLLARLPLSHMMVVRLPPCVGRGGGGQGGGGEGEAVARNGEVGESLLSCEPA